MAGLCNLQRTPVCGQSRLQVPGGALGEFQIGERVGHFAKSRLDGLLVGRDRLLLAGFGLLDPSLVDGLIDGRKNR